MRRLFVVLLVALIVAGCRRSTTPGPPNAPDSADTSIPTDVRFQFVNVAPACGIDFTPTSGTDPASKILEVKGGGIALIDVDGDDDLDVFVPSGATLDSPDEGPGCRLYENRGDMTFVDVTETAGLAGATRWTIGVSAADYDGDGATDLYLSCYGANQLWRNDGTGRFEEVAAHAGVADDRWSAVAAFGDLDADGDLDLYVVNYIEFDAANPPADTTFRGMPVIAGPRGLRAQADVLYENLGDGTFRDVTIASGCAGVEPSYGLGVVILDFTGDGRQDIYVGNDSMPNFLFVNGGDLTFEDQGVRTGAASSGSGANQATMGIAIGDVDGNGRPDVFSTNFASDTNTLLLNKDGRFFDDMTRRYGLGMVSFQSLGWGTGFFDLDHDGYEDLVVFNGHVYPNASVQSMGSAYLQPPLLFEGDAARFERVEPAGRAWLETPSCDRGCAFGDLDGDGDVDIVVNELHGPVRVLRNDSASGHWLQVVVPTGGLGCRVEVAAGDRVWRRWIFSGGSFVSVSDVAAHVGLPATIGSVDVAVIWPDGHTERRQGVSVDQRLRVERGS